MFDAKRLIGRKFDEPCVQSDAKLWPFKIENKGGKPVISVDYKGENKTFMPEEVSSMVRGCGSARALYRVEGRGSCNEKPQRSNSQPARHDSE